jgi:hypothetical protein
MNLNAEKERRMKKWNGKKRIGRKARASRAAFSMGLGALPPGFYTVRFDAAKFNAAMETLSAQYTILGQQLGKTLRTRMLRETVKLDG